MKVEDSDERRLERGDVVRIKDGSDCEYWLFSKAGADIEFHRLNGWSKITVEGQHGIDTVCRESVESMIEDNYSKDFDNIEIFKDPKVVLRE